MNEATPARTNRTAGNSQSKEPATKINLMLKAENIKELTSERIYLDLRDFNKIKLSDISINYRFINKAGKT
jgi:hypothetical protein